MSDPLYAQLLNDIADAKHYLVLWHGLVVKIIETRHERALY